MPLGEGSQASIMVIIHTSHLYTPMYELRGVRLASGHHSHLSPQQSISVYKLIYELREVRLASGHHSHISPQRSISTLPCMNSGESGWHSGHHSHLTPLWSHVWTQGNLSGWHSGHHSHLPPLWSHVWTQGSQVGIVVIIHTSHLYDPMYELRGVRLA